MPPPFLARPCLGKIGIHRRVTAGYSASGCRWVLSTTKSRLLQKDVVDNDFEINNRATWSTLVIESRKACLVVLLAGRQHYRWQCRFPKG